MRGKVMLIGGHLYLLLTPEWLKGYRPATTYVRLV